MVIIEWREVNPVVTYGNVMECPPNFTFGPRIIFDHQFIYIAKGYGTATIQDRTYEALPGDLFYYGPKVTHLFKADEHDPFTLFGIHFSLNGVLPSSGGVRSVNLAAVKPFTSDESDNGLQFTGAGSSPFLVPEHYCIGETWAKELLYRITQYYPREDAISPLFNRILLIEFLLKMMEVARSSRKNSPLHYELISEIKLKLELNAKLPYSRSWLELWSQYNKDHIARLFRQQYGVSPHEYHMEAKFQLAKQWLNQTELTIT